MGVSIKSMAGKRLLYIANIRLPTEKAHGAQIMKMCEAFAELGVSVELVVPRRRNSILESANTYYGIRTPFKITRVFAFDTVSLGLVGFLFESISFALAAVRYAKKGDYEIYYGRDEMILFVFRLFGVRKIIWETHIGSWNIFARFIARHANKIVAISNGLKEFYIKQGVAGVNICVAHDGVDLEQFAHPETKEQARKRLGLPLNKKIAMYIGRLDGWKGVDTLLEASKLLPDDFVVTVIGGESRQVAEFCMQYPNVIFLGYRPYKELVHNQAAADVLVLPNTGKNIISAKYTSPLKLFSYMASGRPIVASDLPSIREVVDEKSVMFVAPDDANRLADGIQSAFGRDDLGQKSSELVRVYSWKNRAEIISTIYYS